MSTAPHDTQLLGAYVLGTLDAQERNEIDRHVETCAACRAELTELEAVRDVLDELPPEALLHGPPDADLVLQRTLRQVRAESSEQNRRGWSMATAAAAIVLAGALGAGVAIGRGTAPTNTADPGRSPSPVVVSPMPPGTKTGTTVDAQTGTRLTATVIPAPGWVRVNASVAGIPIGENCRLIVVGKNNPNGEIASGWIVAGASVNLDGAAAVAPADVTAIKVVNTKGETFVTLKL
jgi:hypothetical protein